MKPLFTCMLLCCASAAMAQDPILHAPAPPFETLKSPGALLKEGAQIEITGIVLGLVLVGIGTHVASEDRQGAAQLGGIIAGAGAVAGISFIIGGKANQVKAGRLLKEQGY